MSYSTPRNETPLQSFVEKIISRLFDTSELYALSLEDNILAEDARPSMEDRLSNKRTHSNTLVKICNNDVFLKKFKQYFFTAYHTSDDGYVKQDFIPLLKELANIAQHNEAECDQFKCIFDIFSKYLLLDKKRMDKLAHFLPNYEALETFIHAISKHVTSEEYKNALNMHADLMYPLYNKKKFDDGLAKINRMQTTPLKDAIQNATLHPALFYARRKYRSDTRPQKDYIASQKDYFMINQYIMNQTLPEQLRKEFEQLQAQSVKLPGNVLRYIDRGGIHMYTNLNSFIIDLYHCLYFFNHTMPNKVLISRITSIYFLGQETPFPFGGSYREIQTFMSKSKPRPRCLSGCTVDEQQQVREYMLHALDFIAKYEHILLKRISNTKKLVHRSFPTATLIKSAPKAMLERYILVRKPGEMDFTYQKRLIEFSIDFITSYNLHNFYNDGYWRRTTRLLVDLKNRGLAIKIPKFTTPLIEKYPVLRDLITINRSYFNESNKDSLENPKKYPPGLVKFFLI